MGDWVFTARKRFTPADAERWTDYINWIGFEHIVELVTLDHMLCPDLIDSPIDRDWSYNVKADCRVTWFHDFPYLKGRCEWRSGRDQIIAMIEEPRTRHEPPSGVSDIGFDILDEYDSISVLTNCGRFPGIIDPTKVNEWGLLSDLAIADSIAAQVRESFPDEPHCMNCRVWQVARCVKL